MTAANRNKGIGIVQTDTDRFYLETLAASGTLSRVYRGTSGSGAPVLVKVCTDDSHNGFMLNEQDILQRVNGPCLPSIVDRFETEDGRIATVFNPIAGIDLLAFRASPKHQNGLSNHFHIGWFLERQLGLLGKLHKAMVVHGNVQPQHLLITPDTHTVSLIDFCYARCHPTARDRIAGWTEHYSAPEIQQGVPPLPGMDIYSLGKCAVFLLGGDPTTGTIPRRLGLDGRIQAFIERMIEPNYLKRPQDAWDLARKILRLRREIYGPPRWVVLEM